MKIIIDSIDQENRVVRLKSVSDEEYAAMEPKPIEFNEILTEIGPCPGRLADLIRPANLPHMFVMQTVPTPDSWAKRRYLAAAEEEDVDVSEEDEQ